MQMRSKRFRRAERHPRMSVVFRHAARDDSAPCRQERQPPTGATTPTQNGSSTTQQLPVFPSVFGYPASVFKKPPASGLGKESAVNKRL